VKEKRKKDSTESERRMKGRRTEEREDEGNGNAGSHDLGNNVEWRIWRSRRQQGKDDKQTIKGVLRFRLDVVHDQTICT